MKLKQVWIEEPLHKRLCKYCEKHGSWKQVISTKAIELGLEELERQQKELESK